MTKAVSQQLEGQGWTTNNWMVNTGHPNNQKIKVSKELESTDIPLLDLRIRCLAVSGCVALEK